MCGSLPIVALALCAWAACKDEDAASKGPADLGARCAQLAKACGDNEKRVEKLLAECAVTVEKQGDKTCTNEASAVYACYEKELCGKDDKVWTLDDLRVLAERHGKCAAERDALRACATK